MARSRRRSSRRRLAAASLFLDHIPRRRIKRWEPIKSALSTIPVYQSPKKRRILIESNTGNSSVVQASGVLARSAKRLGHCFDISAAQKRFGHGSGSGLGKRRSARQIRRASVVLTKMKKRSCH